MQNFTNLYINLKQQNELNVTNETNMILLI